MFDGNGFVLKGYVKCADESYVASVAMYIDGALAETANLPVAKSTSIDDRRVDSFHKYQLPDAAHGCFEMVESSYGCTSLFR